MSSNATRTSEKRAHLVEISTFLGQNKRKKNIWDVLKSLVASPGLENAILNDFLQKFWKIRKKSKLLRFLDVFEVLDHETRGVKIFLYAFRTFSHPQKLIPALKKSIFGQSFEKIRKKNVWEGNLVNG